MNEAVAERIRRDEIQIKIREMDQELETMAKELDRMVADARATVATNMKKNPPA
jgi:hypothetical protein